MCLRHQSNVEESVNHSEDYHKFSIAEARRIKYIKKKITSKKVKFKVN